jgi:hypothetical protein
MTMSICDWKRLTADGTTYPTADQALPLYDDANPAACGLGGTDASNPGGFRWLDTTGTDCRASATVGSGYGVTATADASGACLAVLQSFADSARPVAVPVFGARVDNGDGTYSYEVQGWTAFVVTGWRLPGSDVPSPTRSTCDGAATACVYGYFGRALLPGGGRTGGPDLGARIVALIG